MEKAYKNLEFLNSRDARSLRILSEYIEPLERFCAQPVRKKTTSAPGVDFETDTLQHQQSAGELQEVRSQLETLEGKRWVRWGLRATSGRGWMRLPAAALALLAAPILISLFNGASGSKRSNANAGPDSDKQ